MCAKFRFHYYEIVYTHFEEQVFLGRLRTEYLAARSGRPAAVSGGTGVERAMCRKSLMCTVFMGQYYKYVAMC